jgi:uncharacterized protein with PIN domain
MIVYVESSAVLAWLLGEPSQALVRRTLRDAERVVSSSLTGLECARGLVRARISQRLRGPEELAALRLLDIAESNWDVHEITSAIMTRARATFPSEPVRTLDAIHLTTAAIFNEAVGDVHVLSFDDRIRNNARQLGLGVTPSRLP